jgi:hypothetical protein
MKTRSKIIFINVVIALGVGAIIWVQWPEAMKTRSIGAGYEQALGARLFLAALMTGIPALIYAIFVYVSLSHFLFSPGELKAYRARKLVESIRTTEAPTKSAAPSAQSGNHDFID